VSARLLVCSDCWPAGFELKGMGGVGCCVCGCPRSAAGPITAAQRDGLRRVINAAFDRGRMVGFAEGSR
jgi:hypothetical protein